jgi:hypothetical protein
MHRFALALGSALMVAASPLVTGCSNMASGLTTGATAAGPSAGPKGISNDDPMARPFQVAWTSARGKRCGFFFDPAKLRDTYLKFESKQAAPEQYAKIEKTYDSTFKATSDAVWKDPDYCEDRKATDIKADLQRHLAGDYTPNLPKPKVAQCGSLFDPCDTGQTDEKFESKSFWQKYDADPKSKR